MCVGAPPAAEVHPDHAGLVGHTAALVCADAAVGWSELLGAGAAGEAQFLCHFGLELGLTRLSFGHLKFQTHWFHHPLASLLRGNTCGSKSFNLHALQQSFVARPQKTQAAVLPHLALPVVVSDAHRDAHAAGLGAGAPGGGLDQAVPFPGQRRIPVNFKC